MYTNQSREEPWQRDLDFDSHDLLVLARKHDCIDLSTREEGIWRVPRMTATSHRVMHRSVRHSIMVTETYKPLENHE
jgi:hypothetical protein